MGRTYRAIDVIGARTLAMGSFVAFAATFAPDVRAEQSAPATLTLDKAVASALANHPRIQGARASEAELDVANTDGRLKEGDLVARRGNEELRTGAHVNMAPAKTEDGGVK